MITTLITERLAGKDKAISVATQMIPRSLDFISAVNMFTTDTYREIYTVTGDLEGSWDLVTYILQHIFKEEFHAVRENVKVA